MQGYDGKSCKEKEKNAVSGVNLKTSSNQLIAAGVTGACRELQTADARLA